MPLDDTSVPISALVTSEVYSMEMYAIWVKNATATFSKLAAELLIELEMFSSAYLDGIIILVTLGTNILNTINKYLIG